MKSSFTKLRARLWALLPGCVAGAVVAVCLSGGLYGQGKGSPKQQPKVYESGIVWEEPKQVTPGTDGSPPSDAIVLFDGKNMDAWKGGEKWEIEDGATTARSM